MKLKGNFGKTQGKFGKTQGKFWQNSSKLLKNSNQNVKNTKYLLKSPKIWVKFAQILSKIVKTQGFFVKTQADGKSSNFGCRKSVQKNPCFMLKNQLHFATIETWKNLALISGFFLHAFVATKVTRFSVSLSFDEKSLSFEDI